MSKADALWSEIAGKLNSEASRNNPGFVISAARTMPAPAANAVASISPAASAAAAAAAARPPAPRYYSGKTYSHETRQWT